MPKSKTKTGTQGELFVAPAVLVPVLYAMTGDRDLVDELLAPVGLSAVGDYERRLIRLKEAELEAELLAEEIAELKAQCKAEIRARRGK